MSTRWLQAEIRTERLILRQHRDEDEDALVALMADPEVRRYIGGAQDLEKARQVKAARGRDDTWGHFIVARAGQPLGTISLDRKRGPWEVSFQLASQAWGQGLMPEALLVVTNWFFASVEDEELIAVTQEANARTRRVPEKCGGRERDRFEQYGLPQVLYAFERESR